MSKVSYINGYSGVHKNVTKNTLVVEIYVPFWTKEKGTVVWEFEGEVVNSQEDEKERT